MKQMIKILRKVDIEKQMKEILQLELDYELLSLHDAIKRNCERDREKSYNRLVEIQKELQEIDSKYFG